MPRYLTEPAGRGAAKIYAPRSRPRGAFSGPESAAKLRPYWAVLYLLLALALLCAEGQHAPAADNPSAAPAPRAAKPTREISFGERALININNISMWFQRDGLSAHNPLADIAGVTYPRSTGTVVYQDGLVWGGRILDGVYPPLSRMPSENELGKAFDVSRITVRQALGDLARRVAIAPDTADYAHRICLLQNLWVAAIAASLFDRLNHQFQWLSRFSGIGFPLFHLCNADNDRGAVICCHMLILPYVLLFKAR